MVRKRLTIERLIQWHSEHYADASPKFLKLPYNKQLELVASMHKELLDHPSASTPMKIFAGMIKGEDCIYRLSETFGEHLYKTNLNIPIKVLPKTFKTFYVQFPSSISYAYNGRTFDNVIIDTIDLKGYVDGARAYRFYSLDANATDDGMQVASVMMGVPSAVSGDTILNDQVRALWEQSARSIPLNIMEYCFKILLYITSESIDLVPELGRHPYATNKEKYFRCIENHCPFKVLNIGYGFHERHRHVDETVVSGHFRWQPVGVGLTQVKLIWIDEHIRKYKDTQIGVEHANQN